MALVRTRTDPSGSMVALKPPRRRRRVEIPAWFATSQLVRPAGGKAGTNEFHLLHAKRLGTMHAACGRNAATWFKYWEEFRVGPADRTCRDCVEIVSRSIAR